ncbi:membrane-spanning 4-domains subfamily A member 4A-like [Colossoma macropomum]|uniref:membrane-spanning 4-domains subfamily A member 4A-like n=1 Tax=Colossoma macropomum TaxID=42526 RepID=UPI00186418B5|nr:membrane-spanning 4-domains subfamily A member 4A-like [Colossoma macropomum]XP_036427249.1 membrane-spanning 4-domains subfamily A member 4A-like [Colossoma macropomum]
MSIAAIPDNNTRNGFMVMTQVIPPGQNAVGAGSGVPILGVPNVGVPTVGAHNVGVPTVGVPSAGVPTVGVPTAGVPIITPVSNTDTVTSAQGRFQRFLRSQPKALGTVQIMNGVITLVFGTVLTVIEPPFSVYTGVVYWGSIIYIIAGSLTVSAANRLTPCLVKGSLGMNVSSAVAAGIAVSLLALDFVISVGENPCYPMYNEVCEAYLQFLEQTHGISGVLLVFSVLQLTVSICLSVFGCKATCCTEPVVSVVTVAPNYAACCSMVNPFQAHSGQQDVFYITNPNADVNNPFAQHPSAYCPNSQKPDN